MTRKNTTLFKHTILGIFGTAVLSACGGSGSTSPAPGGTAPPPPPPPPPAGDNLGPADCVNNVAGDFACSGFNLSKLVPLSDFGAGGGNDAWGWTDPSDNTEYAIMGLSNGTGFVRISDPENPVLVGTMATQTVSSTWRDIKVYQNHAFVVADGAGAHGMQVFDLTRLRGESGNVSFTPDAVYSGVDNSHNVVINEATGFAYLVGTNTCGGGLHMVDISTPTSPQSAGCHSASGYTHDAQCVNYTGPDADYAGAEICFASNEDDVAIINVSNKNATAEISSVVYPSFGYTHQGWLTENQEYLFVGDELDERDNRVRTSTIVLDVRDLDNPQYLYTHQADTNAIDHNMYTHNGRLYQANYQAGLRVLDFTDLSTDTLTETGYFDTYPEDNEVGFDGAWSVYPYFASGTIIVSDGDRGLFILTPQ